MLTIYRPTCGDSARSSSIEAASVVLVVLHPACQYLCWSKQLLCWSKQLLCWSKQLLCWSKPPLRRIKQLLGQSKQWTIVHIHAVLFRSLNCARRSTWNDSRNSFLPVEARLIAVEATDMPLAAMHHLEHSTCDPGFHGGLCSGSAW